MLYNCKWRRWYQQMLKLLYYFRHFRRLWFSFPPRDELPPLPKKETAYIIQELAAQGGDRPIYDLIQSPSYNNLCSYITPPGNTLFQLSLFVTHFILFSSSSTAWAFNKKNWHTKCNFPSSSAGRRGKRRWGETEMAYQNIAPSRRHLYMN